MLGEILVGVHDISAMCGAHLPVELVSKNGLLEVHTAYILNRLFDTVKIQPYAYSTTSLTGFDPP